MAVCTFLLALEHRAIERDEMLRRQRMAISEENPMHGCTVWVCWDTAGTLHSAGAV